MTKWVIRILTNYLAYRVLDYYILGKKPNYNQVVQRVQDTIPQSLGIVDTSNRTIKDGSQYDYLFPMAKYADKQILKDTSIHSTVQRMIAIIKNTRSQTRDLANYLRKNTTAQTLQAVFNFTFDHIAYKLDSADAEELRTPARSWADRSQGIDCDCFSIFIGSILYNLNIPFVVRIADYGEGYQHVYIVAKDKGQEVILDPVILQYDYEKPTTKHRDYQVI